MESRDWSSDVCSSDLRWPPPLPQHPAAPSWQQREPQDGESLNGQSAGPSQDLCLHWGVLIIEGAGLGVCVHACACVCVCVCGRVGWQNGCLLQYQASWVSSQGPHACSGVALSLSCKTKSTQQPLDKTISCPYTWVNTLGSGSQTPAAQESSGELIKMQIPGSHQQSFWPMGLGDPGICILTNSPVIPRQEVSAGCAQRSRLQDPCPGPDLGQGLEKESSPAVFF